MSSQHRSNPASLLALFALCGVSCGVWQPSQSTARIDEVALPVDVAATLVAAALRDDLHAEPAAPACGAPARRVEGGYVVTFERGPGGHWLPRADLRLSLRRTDGRGAVLVHTREIPAPGLLGFGRRSTGAVDVQVRATGTRCRVVCRAPTAVRERIEAVVRRTLELACCEELGGPGAAEGNLVVWRLGQLLTHARHSERNDERSALLRAAARLPGAPSEVFEQLSELFAAEGQHQQAAAHLQRAALLEPDLERRATLARLAADACERQLRPAGLRSEALDHLMTGDLPGAEQRLHSARRADPAPALDYHLLSTLHRYRGDEMAALAAELLAREYKHSAAVRGSAPLGEATNTWAQSMTEWSRRLTLGARPVRASSQLYGVQRLGASRGR